MPNDKSESSSGEKDLKSAENIYLYEIMSLREAELTTAKQVSDIKYLDEPQFRAAFRKMVKRLDLSDLYQPKRPITDNFAHLFWLELASKLLVQAPEFKELRIKGRRPLGKHEASQDYYRFLAVRDFRQKNSNYENRPNSFVIRKLVKNKHELFLGTDQRALENSVSRGKTQYEEALERARASKNNPTSK